MKRLSIFIVFILSLCLSSCTQNLQGTVWARYENGITTFLKFTDKEVMLYAVPKGDYSNTIFHWYYYTVEGNIITMVPSHNEWNTSTLQLERKANSLIMTNVTLNCYVGVFFRY